MIPVWILKFVGRRLYKTLKYNKQQRIIDNYVNKPNELDIQMKQAFKTLNKFGKDKEVIEKELAILKSESHPPQFPKKAYRDIVKRLKNLEKKGEAK